MKDLLEYLKDLNFPIYKIVQQPILDNKGIVIAWNFYVQNKEGISLAGGTHVNVDIAKKIAIAESFERALAKEISGDPTLSKDFLLNEFPTSCGFASGFDRESTRIRAIREGVERWAWSKWIDDGFKIDEIQNFPSSMDPLSKHIFEAIPKVRLFKKDELLIQYEDLNLNYSFLVLILETDKGVFAGCRAGLQNEDLISHAAIEGFRNYRNFMLLSKNADLSTNSIVANRNTYFGEHKEEAFSQIEKARYKSWPNIKIKLLKEYPTNIPKIYLWRCLMNEFLGWHIGDEKRFVY